jgi:hypothetical protein
MLRPGLTPWTQVVLIDPSGDELSPLDELLYAKFMSRFLEDGTMERFFPFPADASAGMCQNDIDSLGPDAGLAVEDIDWTGFESWQNAGCPVDQLPTEPRQAYRNNRWVWLPEYDPAGTVPYAQCLALCEAKNR